MDDNPKSVPYAILFTAGIVALVLINGAITSKKIILWIAAIIVTGIAVLIAREAFFKKH